jgi:malate dehydrogenase (oxaloacetate-decarboxylating)
VSDVPPDDTTDDQPSLDGRDITEEEVFAAHEAGKLSVAPTVGLAGRRDLAIAYTPGVAKVCRAIADDKALTARYTWTHRLVAVVSDGTAVLGLGDIGPRASLPVMEGKSALFKAFADLDSIPLVLETTDVDEIVDTLVHLRPSFGAVNLEDIAAPRCFEIERRLIEALDCPVMHDDQHGTAIVVLAALKNAVRVLGRDLASLRVVVSGAGASGVACAKILMSAGAHDVVVLDSRGVIHAGREGMNVEKIALAEETNPRGVRGDLATALEGADVFLGLSGSTVPEAVIAAMADDAIVFALSNPDPEIDPEVARKHAAVVATGRSDYPNQINNVLAFPGVFAGALDAAARRITEAMKLAAADAIADIAAGDEGFGRDHIVPSALDARVAPAVAEAVARAASEEGVVRRHVAEVAAEHR